MLCEGWTGNTLDAGVLHGGGRVMEGRFLLEGEGHKTSRI